jgi:TIR domain
MKRVFISYSWKDSAVAEQVKGAIPSQFDVWIDKERVRPGDEISKALQDGLSASDYYVILISDNSIASNWVKREIATAFDLATKKKLSVIPVILQGAEVPFEFRGLLYIDFRASLIDGLKSLNAFFISQETIIKDIEPKQPILKSSSDVIRRRLACNNSLRELSLSDLRYLMADKLGIDEVAIVWFDLFERRMIDEIQVRNLALCCVELIDMSRRTDVLGDLLDTLCRNFPYISKGL